MTTARYTGSMERYAKTALRQAMADAATELAEMSQQRTRDGLQRRFKIRNPSLAKFVKRKRASSRTLTAQVVVEGPAGRRGLGSILARHEEGGTQTPDNTRILFRRAVDFLTGARPPSFAVPTSAVKEGARSRVTRANKPRNLRDAFVKRDKDGDFVLFRRKYAKTRRETVEGLFILKPRVRLRPRLQLKRDAEVTIRRNSASVFRKQMALSLARNAMRRGFVASSPTGAA